MAGQLTSGVGAPLVWVTMKLKPNAFDANETIVITHVAPGDTVLNAFAVIDVESTNGGTAASRVGDGGDPNRFVDLTDLDPGAAGTILAGVTAAFPFVYTSADTIDYVYTAGNEAAKIPEVTCFILIARAPASDLPALN